MSVDPIRCSVSRLKRRAGDAFIIRLPDDVDVQFCEKEVSEIEDLLVYLNIRLPEILVKRMQPERQVRQEALSNYLSWKERISYFPGQWKHRMNYLSSSYMFSEKPLESDLESTLRFADTVTSAVATCLNSRSSIAPGTVLQPLSFPNFGIASERYRCLWLHSLAQKKSASQRPQPASTRN